MTIENEFEPRFGRMQSSGGKRARKYLGRVLAAANLARGGVLVPTAGRSGFTGSRIGRGAGVGRLLTRRGAAAAFGARRVVIKASLVRLAGRGAAGAAAHLRYLQRDGTTREGHSGALYSADTDAADGKAFRERGVGDRHQFRFIVSPEDGADYEDLKSLTRRLMARVEQDLGTRLDWVAIDHFNTGHPHTHIVVRGKDELGGDLIIARDYLTTGMRERASELVDLDLGPRSARDVEANRRAEVEKERLTSIDRSLLDGADSNGIILAGAGDAFEQALRAARLAKLSRLGLAAPIGGGCWRLADGLEDTLRRMGERGDIIRTMQRDLAARGVARAVADQAIYQPSAGNALPLVGRLVARGLADEHADRHYLIVDGVDGRSHYVAIGKGADTEPIAEGSVVRVVPLQGQVRDVDRTVAAVAAANSGRYDVDAHLRYDPSATEAFAEAHVRRLEAMRRQTGGVLREPSGQWVIGDDHLAHAAAHEARLLRDRPVAVEMLSAVPLSQLVDAEAATWLDRDLAGGAPAVSRDAGFGAELGAARAARRQWLIGEGLAHEDGGVTRFRAGAIEELQRREILRAAAGLREEIGLPFREAGMGDQVEGVVRRRVDLVSGRFALLENAREFMLVPWRPVLEPRVGKAVAGLVRSEGISWAFGRGRSGPTIS